MQFRSILFLSLLVLLNAAGPLTFAQTSQNPAEIDVRPSNADCVVVLHGLGRTRWSMSKIAKELELKGILVWNKSYSSRSNTIEELAAVTIEKGLNYCAKYQPEKIHFVTHSMGGILLRQYLQENSIDTLGRIVMLSPPNKGSEVVDFLKKKRAMRWVLGTAGL